MLLNKCVVINQLIHHCLSFRTLNDPSKHTVTISDIFSYIGVSVEACAAVVGSYSLHLHVYQCSVLVKFSLVTRKQVVIEDLKSLHLSNEGAVVYSK